jgi:hypothetical protein
VRKAKMESKKQQQEREDSERPTNAHLECIVRPTSRGQPIEHQLNLFSTAEFSRNLKGI